VGLSGVNDRLDRRVWNTITYCCRPTIAVKFYIGHLSLLCCPHDGSALSALLKKWVRRHPIASSSHTSLDSWIAAWGSVSDLHACVGFHDSKKVEEHWSVVLLGGLSTHCAQSQSHGNQ